MKTWMPWLLVVALVGAVAYALGSSNRTPEPISAAPVAPAPLAAPVESAPDTPGADATILGVIREHKDVSQYTYLRLDTDAGETWAAVYRAPVKDGASVTVIHASSVQAFHSRELARDFPTIWFGMLPGYETAPADSAATASPSLDAGKTRISAPAGAISIADLAKKAATLDGTQVTVAGHVVKENEGILGRTWIHLQDGTGSASDKTNDLLVTTDGTAKVGDVVQATGTVRTKQDYGSGYAYDFLIEKATLTTR